MRLSSLLPVLFLATACAPEGPDDLERASLPLTCSPPTAYCVGARLTRSDLPATFVAEGYSDCGPTTVDVVKTYCVKTILKKQCKFVINGPSVTLIDVPPDTWVHRDVVVTDSVGQSVLTQCNLIHVD